MNNGYRKKDSARIVWDTKPKRAPNPKDIEFQTAEVVIPNPAKAGQLPISFRDKLFGEEELDKQKMNRLIWGDNLLAMQALLAQGYEGKVNLIYIDPPFDSKADYAHKIKLPASAGATADRGEFEFTKEPSVIERLAYKDTWAGGTDSYLDMLFPRLQLMKRLLAPDGSIYVHLDWHVGHYVKVMMDEIFGKGEDANGNPVPGFRNEIIWYYSGGGASKDQYAKKHDTILFYTKHGTNYTFNVDEIRMEYKWTGGQKRADGSERNLEKGKIPDDVMGLDVIKLHKILPWASENTEYDTQKPEALTSIILRASSKDGDVVADFFNGSGTTISVAERLNRRWIATDLGKASIQVTRGRLVEQKSKPFLIENIGNYQREMIYLGGVRIYEMQKIILKLYGAEPMQNRKDLGARLPAPRLPVQGTQTGRECFFVYAILCDNNSIYIGQTNDLSERWKEHCGGRAGWTEKYKPVEIIHYEEFGTRDEAVEREKRLKTGFGRKWIKRELRAGRLKKWSEDAARQAGKAEDGVLELVYCGYPDRAVSARKAEELLREAADLDGAGYKRLVILAWDYEYNYDELLASRLRAAGKDIKTEVVSRQIPPDIYEYLKQAKSEGDIEALSEKVKFFEKPYLKMARPEVNGKNVSIGIANYMLYDFPLGSGKKADEAREELLKLSKDNFAVLIDYWAVDWNYDGFTFKSQWQDLRGNGRRAKVVGTNAEHTYEKAGTYTIAVRVVDIFGNDATGTLEVTIK